MSSKKIFFFFFAGYIAACYKNQFSVSREEKGMDIGKAVTRVLHRATQVVVRSVTLDLNVAWEPQNVLSRGVTDSREKTAGFPN